ncbi:MAG TPA: response regulator transcription factor [Burkholderiaceae bacterium]|nr:response regulator transcription factor [Burkholderiaceae bacterium]
MNAKGRGAGDSSPASGDQAIVFVVDDDALVRDSIEDLLHSVGLQVRLFASPREFLQAPRPDAPGCLVLDVRLPEQSGLDFQKELAGTAAELPIVFITGHGDIPMSVRAMKWGAVEFLTKPFRDQDLLDAIQAAITRDRTRRAEAGTLRELRRRYEALSPRERQVMLEVVSGQLNKQVAAELDLSEATVKTHRGQIMRKMQADSLPELVRIADRLGLATGKRAIRPK